MKIDIYNHVLPPAYFAKMQEVAPGLKDLGKRVSNIPCLVDLDVRFRFMDEFGDDYRQVISVASPSVEELGGPDVTPILVRLANDGMAEYVEKYPDRFVGFVANVSMNNPDAAVEEIDRAINTLGARGIQIFTNVNGRPLDEPDFMPIYECMAGHDLPIWIHPTRQANFPDYQTEDRSLYEIWWTFGWPYETSVAMARLVFSGLFDRFPNLKFITHHMGGMAPYFEGRVGHGWDQLGTRTSDTDYGPVLEKLKKRPIDYFRMFLADTAVFGSASATRCGLDFFGVDNVLFASDSPFDPERGPMYIRETIRVIDELEISDQDRQKIYHGNAERLLRLSVD